MEQSLRTGQERSLEQCRERTTEEGRESARFQVHHRAEIHNVRSDTRSWIQVAQSVESRHADRKLSSRSSRGAAKMTKLDLECAKRWRHCLDPSIDHSRWTPSDDMRLLKAVEDYGHNWRAIENKEFQGRSPTNIKNRYARSFFVLIFHYEQPWLILTSFLQLTYVRLEFQHFNTNMPQSELISNPAMSSSTAKATTP